MQQVDEAKKNNKLIEIYSHVFIYITFLKEVINFLICEVDL